MTNSIRDRIAAALANGFGRSRTTHATEAELMALALNPDPLDPLENDRGDRRIATREHADDCPRCATELDDFRTTLDALRAEAACEEAISPARLARQRARILRRIRALIGPPARILRFPAIAKPPFSSPSTATRWLGAAAAAGLVVGIAIGQFVDNRSPDVPAQAAALADTATSPSATQTSARLLPVDPVGTRGPLDDEQLMAKLEEAVTTPRVATLVALDELTPRLRDVAVDVR